MFDWRNNGVSLGRSAAGRGGVAWRPVRSGRSPTSGCLETGVSSVQGRQSAVSICCLRGTGRVIYMLIEKNMSNFCIHGDFWITTWFSVKILAKTDMVIPVSIGSVEGCACDGLHLRYSVTSRPFLSLRMNIRFYITYAGYNWSHMYVINRGITQSIYFVLRRYVSLAVIEWNYCETKSILWYHIELYAISPTEQPARLITPV